jgi:hypothetical protein
MKILLLGVTAVIFVIICIANNPQHSSRPLTQFQKCKETASHLRTDEDTAYFMQNFCARLPVEDGDYR